MTTPYELCPTDSMKLNEIIRRLQRIEERLEALENIAQPSVTYRTEPVFAKYLETHPPKPGGIINVKDDMKTPVCRNPKCDCEWKEDK